MPSATQYLSEQENNKKVPVTVTIPISTLEKTDSLITKLLSDYPGVTRSSLVSAALEHYILTLQKESN